MEDARIVAMYLRRDEQAISATQERYGSRLRALAYGITADSPTAEECENDTYLQAWQSIPPHAPYTYLFAFLGRITRHLALNCCRGRAALKRGGYVAQLGDELTEAIPAPDDAACRLEAQELKAAINGFLATLSRESRTIFLRRYWYMEDIADIARRYRFTESKVKTSLHRTREKLRDYLVKEGYEL